MFRTTIMLLMVFSLLGGAAGGCSPEAREARRQKKELKAQQKAEAKQQKAQKDQAKRDAKASGKKDPLAPRDKFEASDDPPFNADTRFAAGQLAESQGNYEN